RRRRRGPIWSSNRPRGRRAPPRCSAGSERVPILTPSLGGLRDLGGYSGAVSRPRRRRIRASSTGEGPSAERNPVELLPLLLIFAVMMLPLLFLSSRDRKSTRLNSSHVSISYAVFCLKKKKSSHM